MGSSSLLKKVLTPLRIVTILSMLLALFAPFTQLEDVFAAATFTATPSPVNFGNVAINVTSAVSNITVTNTGTAGSTITINIVSTRGTNLGDFSIVSDNCTSKIITTSGAGSSCIVGITFKPVASGSRTATLRFSTSIGFQDITLNGTGVKRATTTTVSCAPTTISVNNSTSCNVTVTDTQGSGTTSSPGTGGSVTMSSSGEGTFGTCTLSTGNPSATCTVSYTPTAGGTHAITATYNGGTNHTTSNGSTATPITVNVVFHATTVSVGCSPNPVFTGTATSCSATVTDTSASPTTPGGSVSFSNGSNIGSCTLNSGACALNYTPTSDGSQTVTATYGGDSSHSTSNNTTTLVVKVSTTTTVGCDPNPDNVGGATVCTATVTVANAQPQPAGMVSFSSTGSGSFGTGGTCSLVNGGTGSSSNCLVTYTPGVAGNVSIVANYDGGTRWQATSGSTTLGVQANPRTTSTAIVCTPGTLSVGDPDNCVISVTDNQAGGTVSAPLGTVTLSVSPSSDGSFSSASCTLNASTASASSCSITYTPSASSTQTISASYIPNDSVHATSSSTVSLTVNKTSTNLSVSAATGTYGGTANLTATLSAGGNGISGKIVTFTLNGGNVGTATTDGSGIASLSNVSLSGVNAGTYNTGVGASFAGDGTYAGTSGSAALTVDKATATLALDSASLHQVYNGSPRIVTVTINPAGLSGVNVTYAGNSTAPMNAGSYTIVASLTNPNYTAPNATGTLQITQATATLTLSNLSQVYDGSPRSATVTTNPPGLSGVTVTYDAASTIPTNAGSYVVVASLNDPNYLPATANGTLVISPAPATITLNDLSQTYDGTPKAVIATTNPAGLNVVSITYDGNSTAPTNVGSYAIVASLSNPNYTAPNATGTLVIGKASVTITLSGLNQTYDGTVKAVTATTNPAGLAVNITYNGSSTAPTNAGSYTIVATVSDSNYQGSANATLVVAKAPATVTLSNLSYTYDGATKSATVATSPAGLAVNITYNGSASLPKNAGSYTVAAALDDTNYQGSATDTLVIARVALVGTAQDKTKLYGADLPALTVNYRGFVNGEGVEVLNGTLNCSTSATVASPVGRYAIDCSGQSGSNYNVSYVPGMLTITSATLTGTADNKTRIFGEVNPALTVTYTGFANGDTLNILTGMLDCSTTATTSSPIGDYPITCSGQIAPNYTMVYVAGTLSITSAPTILVVSAVTGTYNGTVNLTATLTSDSRGVSGKTIIFTLNGGAVGTATTDSAGIATISSASLSGITAGIYPAGMGASFAADTGYAAASASASLTVNKAAASVILSDLNKTYDGTVKTASVAIVPSGLTVVMTYSQNNNPVAGPINAGSYNVSATINETNYEGSASAALIIAKADQAISFAPLSDTVYGDPGFSLFAMTTSGLTVNFAAIGTCSVSDTSLTIAGAGNCTVTASQAGNSNYNAAQDVVRSFTVFKATPTIIWNDPDSIVYGTALDGTQLNATASVTGTLVYTPAAGTVLNAGTNQSLVVDFTPTDTANYNTATKTVRITVTQAPSTITWNNPANIVYGTVLGATQLNATASVAGTLVYTPAAGTALNVGQNQQLSVTFTPADTLNYTASSQMVYINVAPAPLSVKATDKSRVYGAENPYFTVNYSGFVLGQDETSLAGTLSFDTAANPTSPVGSFQIIPSGLNSSNYTITFLPGTLAVNPAPLTVKADDKSKIFADPLPVFTASYSGFVLGETSSVLGGTLVFSTTAGTLSPVGTYSIMPGGLTSSNYAITFVDGTLTVTAYVDHTAPTTVASLFPAANAAGWRNSNVTISLTATDETFGAGIESITYSATGAQPIGSTTVNGSSATLPVITTEGITTVTFFAKDNAGNTETSKTVIVNLDKTGPTSVTGTPDRSPDNTNGWYNHPVTISFSGFDLLSAIDSCTSTTYSELSGSNLSVSGSCTDKAGNTTSATYRGLKYDATNPVTTATISQGAAPANADGWYPYTVNVNLNTVDEANGSGVKQLIYSAVGAGGFATKTSSNGFATFAITKNGITFINYQGLDQAGNLEPVKTLMVKIDTTAPTVTATVSPVPNAAKWNNSDVTVTLTGSDNASGVKSISYRINDGAKITTVSGTTATIPVTTNGTTSISYWATDMAGNGNEGYSRTISVKLDTVVPTVTSSNDGMAYKLNQNAKVSFSCSDPGGSGVATCVGSVANGSKLNTTSLGTKSYMVTATDKAGNTYTRTITYTVVA